MPYETVKTPREMMKHVRGAVGDIDAMKWDGERAHGMEDGLYVEVLEWITKSPYTTREVRNVAALALEANKLEYARY